MGNRQSTSNNINEDDDDNKDVKYIFIHIQFISISNLVSISFINY